MQGLGAAVAAAVIALLLVVACGKQEEVGFGGAPATTADPSGPVPSSADPVPPVLAPDPAGPPAPPGATPVPAPRIDASALPEGYPRVAWTEGDGSTVGAFGVANSGCVEVSGELAEQNPQRVVLRVVEHTTSPGPCTMEIRFEPVTAQLAAPLGERTVVLQRTTMP